MIMKGIGYEYFTFFGLFSALQFPFRVFLCLVISVPELPLEGLTSGRRNVLHTQRRFAYQFSRPEMRCSRCKVATQQGHVTLSF